MTGSNFTKLVRHYTGTNADTLPDEELLLLANVEKDDLAEFIADQVGEDIFSITMTRDLETDKREYGLPRQTLLNIKRMSVLLGGEYRVLKEIDINDFRLPMVTEENVRFAMAGRKPVFDFLDTGFKIYSEQPIIAHEDGIVLENIIYPEDLLEDNLSGENDLSTPSSAITTRLPKAAHKVWALKTSIAYKESRPKPVKLNKTEENVEAYIERMINNIKGRNLDRSTAPQGPVDTGMNY